MMPLNYTQQTLVKADDAAVVPYTQQALVKADDAAVYAHQTRVIPDVAAVLYPALQQALVFPWLMMML